MTISTWGLAGALVPDAGLAAGSALIAAFGAVVGFAGSVVVMSFTPWLLNDISNKVGSEGVSGEILEISVEIHERDAE